MTREVRRKTPEELLRHVEAEEDDVTNGKLKIFLGYASGVGKSFRMLDEGRRRRERGQDVVVGAVQPAMAPDVQDLLSKLETIPLRSMGQGSAMDMEALLQRHPSVCVVDGLAYDNPPGSRNPTRWQDVMELLKDGISVVASVNIQYVEELREQVQAITGKHVTQTVPIAVIKSAHEIEIVDATAVGSAEDAPRVTSGAATREQRLSKLRELALVLAADVVDQQLLKYLQSHGMDQNFGTHERILVCITPRANIREMIDVARVISEKFHGELMVAYVKQPEISSTDQKALDEKLQLARDAGACIQMLEGKDPVGLILSFAKSHGVTQLFIGHSQRAGFWSRVWGSPVDKLIQGSRGIDIRVFPQ